MFLATAMVPIFTMPGWAQVLCSDMRDKNAVLIFYSGSFAA